MNCLDIEWNYSRWPNFSPKELACHCCGEILYTPEDFDAIQKVRSLLGRPIVINSGHRCPIQNARVGGSPKSQHKRIAFDISIAGHSLLRLLESCEYAGFTGYGFYQTFLHVDRGRPRKWWTTKGKEKWNGLIL
jgi:zinc D-Ala-D-Ala carboxypeptidase